MSDRRFVSVKCREEDLAAFEEIGFFEDFRKGKVVCMMIDEDDVCLEEEEEDSLPALAKRGIPFYGHHEGSAQYHAHVIASDGTCYVDPASGGCSDRPVAVIRRDRTPDPDHLALAMRYWDVYERAVEMIDGSSVSSSQESGVGEAAGRSDETLEAGNDGN